MPVGVDSMLYDIMRYCTAFPATTHPICFQSYLKCLNFREFKFSREQNFARTNSRNSRKKTRNPRNLIPAKFAKKWHSRN